MAELMTNDAAVYADKERVPDRILFYRFKATFMRCFSTMPDRIQGTGDYADRKELWT